MTQITMKLPGISDGGEYRTILQKPGIILIGGTFLPQMEEFSTCRKKTFTVSYDVSISFSKTGMSFTYGDTGVTNTVTISGNGVSTVAYGISNNQIVSARWGNWNQGNIPLTITPKAAGSTTVWVDAKDKNGHVITSKSFQVTVNKASPRLSFASSSLHKTYGTGSFTNTLTKTTDGTISYSSSDTSIASVNSAGMVTINRAGSCTITATASSGNNYTSGSSRYTLTVDKAFPSMSFANSSITKPMETEPFAIH